MCLVLPDRVLTGDTLLIGATGRTDLPTGDPEALHESLFGKLLGLDDALRVFPAHDYKGRESSTLGAEKSSNPRLQKKERAAFVAEKRREYEEEVVRTFYLSNADLKETMDLLRIVLDARRISPVTGTNALAMKDTPERITAAARILSAIDKARPEVLIDVELLDHLAPQRRRVRLAVGDLAAWKLPHPREVHAVLAARDEEAAVVLDDGRDDRDLHQD